jgi:hypothetical protein
MVILVPYQLIHNINNFQLNSQKLLSPSFGSFWELPKQNNFKAQEAHLCCFQQKQKEKQLRFTKRGPNRLDNLWSR